MDIPARPVTSKSHSEESGSDRNFVEQIERICAGVAGVGASPKAPIKPWRGDKTAGVVTSRAPRLLEAHPLSRRGES